MWKLTVKLLAICVIFVFLFGCKSEPEERMGKSKISGICRGQKIFFKKNGRYGTYKELLNADLADDDLTRNWGYTSEVKITETGYLATVVPNDFAKAGMFYVDEKKIIKVHYGDANIQPNDAECSYSNGAKCPCYDE